MPNRDVCTTQGCADHPDLTINVEIRLCTFHWATAHAAYENHIETNRLPRRVPIRTSAGSPVVYYVAMNDRIKIGWTSRFQRRMHQMYVQREDVLAVEPGGQRVEHSRHLQFSYCRVERTELFERDSVLLHLIDELRTSLPVVRYATPFDAGLALYQGRHADAA